MPRINRVKRCRKSRVCGKCRTLITPGLPYLWWKFRYGALNSRCMESACYPRRSELTQSEILGNLYDLQDDADKAVSEACSIEELTAAKDEVVDRIGSDLIEIMDEKLESIESGMGHTELPVYEELEERKGEFEGWMEDLECWEAEDYTEDEDLDAEEQLEAARDALTEALAATPE